MNGKRWIVCCNNIESKIWNSYKWRRKKGFVIKTTETQSYQQKHQQ